MFATDLVCAASGCGANRKLGGMRRVQRTAFGGLSKKDRLLPRSWYIVTGNQEAIWALSIPPSLIGLDARSKSVDGQTDGACEEDLTPIGVILSCFVRFW